MATTAATPKPEMTSNHKQDMHSVQGEPSLEERIGMKPIPTTTVRHAAPVVQERVHDLYTHVDKTQVDEIRSHLDVVQTVQPIVAKETQKATHEVKDGGLHVMEHGTAGLTEEVEAELRRKREKIAADHASTQDETRTETSDRPEVRVSHRLTRLEQVVPVVERDVYRPHEIEHFRREVHIFHEAPKLVKTEVAKAITLEEWESQQNAGGYTSQGAVTQQERSNNKGTDSTTDTSKTAQHEKFHVDSTGQGAAAALGKGPIS